MWKYGEAGRLLTINSAGSDNCIFCKYVLYRFPSQKFEVGQKRLLVQLSICVRCGWWVVYRIHQGEFPRTAGIIESHSGTIGCLKELDLSDVSIPLDEVRQYFLVNKNSIYDVHPRVFEDIVCSIFKDFGWKARVTAYSGDDGIDVILDAQNGETIGIQVKRYKKERKIEAEQIRSLAGALLIGKHTKGIFITTSAFRKGALRTAQKLTTIGSPIELMDAERFLDALGIAQIKSFKLSDGQIKSYLLSRGIHIGSGLEKDFKPDEDLRERQIISSIYTSEELIDLCGNDV